MRYLDVSAGSTLVGLAFGPTTPSFLEADPGCVDYVELPFEQLVRSPDLESIQDSVPVILHCASMSIAGFVPPAKFTLDAIAAVAKRTRTPWIGEHLAFISADALERPGATRDAPAPTRLSYTVCPQMSEETVERVEKNLASLRPRFGPPLILENSPVYFELPGSTMSMAEFISEVSLRCDVGLLLDLTHFLIAASNTGVDAETEIERLPLERVVEVHISGLTEQSGIVWDDHARPAPPAVFALLERVVERVCPRAVTLEYNWASDFPHRLLKRQIDRIRRIVGGR